MEPRLIAYIVGLALSLTTSLAAIASQSGTFIGVHEVPPFVCDRIDLVAGLSHGRAGGERSAPENPAVSSACTSICAR